LFQPSGNQIQIRLSLLVRHTRFQTSDDSSSWISAAIREAFCREADGHRNVCFHPELEIRWSNPNNGEALGVECELFAENIWITAEPALPESVTQNHRRSRPRTVFLRQKVAPEQTLNAQSGKKFRRHEPPLQALRFASACKVKTLAPTHRRY
jgi:hypothetical protein